MGDMDSGGKFMEDLFPEGEEEKFLHIECLDARIGDPLFDNGPKDCPYCDVRMSTYHDRIFEFALGELVLARRDRAVFEADTIIHVCSDCAHEGLGCGDQLESNRILGEGAYAYG